METMRCKGFCVPLLVSLTVFAPAARGLAIVGPGETILCTRNFSAPNNPGHSESTKPRELRARAVGAFATTDNQVAWQSYGFVALADGDVTITVPGIVYQGLLDAHFAGAANRARVRIMAVLRELGDNTNLVTDVVHDRLHTSGGPSGDDNLFAPVDAVLEHQVDGGTGYTVMVRIEVEARGVDAQADYLTGASEEGIGGRRMFFGCVEIVSEMADSDGDGLPDQIEESGLPGLDLPALGATPDHQDIFLEIDWLQGREPTQAAVRAVKEAFARAPRSNPDGVDGIRLHVDTGDLTDGNASEDGQEPGTCGDGVNNDPAQDAVGDEEDPDCLVGDLVFSSLVGGADLGDGGRIPAGHIPNGTNIPDLLGDLDGNDRSDFLEVRGLNFDLENRLGIFHYAISAEDLTVGGGQAEVGGGNIILGTTRASTLMHELGHNLGLRHGGDEGDLVPDEDGEEGNCKPNYVSIMNYQHALNGGIPTRGASSGQDLDGNGDPDNKIVDFSPPRFAGGGRGQAPLPPLREDALDDEQILDGTDVDNQFIFVDPEGRSVTRGLDVMADWNSGPGAVNPININTSNEDGSPSVCTNDRLDDELTGFDDWQNIDLRIRGFGDLVAGMFNPTTTPEPTDEEIDAFEARLNTTDLGITKSHSPDLAVAGQPIVYTLAVTNHGPNPARDVRVIDTLPPEVSVLELPSLCVEGPPRTVTCQLGELEYGDTVEIVLQARVAANLPCKGRQRIFVTNTAEVSNLGGTDPEPDNDRAHDRAEVLCIQYEYAAKVLCGVQPHPTDLRLATGLYATSINIHNPNDLEVGFFKKLALAFPPAEQRAGEVIPIAVDFLDYDEALKTDCNELRRLLPDDVAGAAPYFEGFVVVQSPLSLDVTGVYTTAALDKQGRASGHSSVDVEAIPERKRKVPADLSIVKRAASQGETAPQIRYTVAVANEGLVAAEEIVVEDALEMQAGTLVTILENEFGATHGSGWVIRSSGPSGAELQAQIPKLDPGETATLSFAVVTLTDIGAGQTHVVNTAAVQSTTADADLGNNSTTIETIVELP